jgi:addiction module RelE/StbE family toxin
MRVIWTEQALRELEAIGDYIARDNQRAAVTAVTRILDLVDLLGEPSEIGRPGRIAGARELVVTNTPFVVPYRVGENRIEVLSVFHGARKWPESFD